MQNKKKKEEEEEDGELWVFLNFKNELSLLIILLNQSLNHF